MNWLSYFFPTIVERFSSQFNPDVRIILENGRLKLLSSGIRESGETIEKMYQKTFNYFHINRQTQMNRVLMLGVAGGTAIYLLKSINPEAHIVAVDIDPLMIDIGKTFFGLNQLRDISYHVSDAYDYILRKPQKTEKYDLVFVDLYIGSNIPDFVHDPDFLAGLAHRLNSTGAILINYAYDAIYIQKSKTLQTELVKIFKSVNSYQINKNIEYFASNV